MAVQTLVQRLIDPTFSLFIAAAILCLWRFHSKRAALLALAPFYLLTTSVGPYVFNTFWRTDDTIDPERRYAVVAPLGGAGSASNLLAADFQSVRNDASLFFNPRIARVIAALVVMKDGRGEMLYYPEVTIEGFSETDLVRQFCLAHGLESERFFVYAATRRTSEEALRLKAALATSGKLDVPVLLITSELHMRRAYAMFHKQGLRPDRLSVNRRHTPLEAVDFVPSFNGLHDVGAMFYELVAYGAYRVLGAL